MDELDLRPPFFTRLPREMRHQVSYLIAQSHKLLTGGRSTYVLLVPTPALTVLVRFA